MEAIMALRSREITSREATTTITSSNINMAESLQPNSQNIIIGQFRSVVEQIENNQKAFSIRIDNIGTAKLKMLAVKRFNRMRLKLKGFLV